MEQLPASGIADGDHRRMFQLPFDRNSEETTADLLGTADSVKTILLQLLLED
jgi:hypothetical protein